MLMTIEELRQFVVTSEADAVLELRIQALESAIIKYTNNQFKDGFPPDVKLGALKMLKWDIEDKVGIQSETISRHTVTYFNTDGGDNNTALGYPKRLTDFLKPYRKAQF